MTTDGASFLAFQRNCKITVVGICRGWKGGPEMKLLSNGEDPKSCLVSSCRLVINYLAQELVGVISSQILKVVKDGSLDLSVMRV